MHQEVCLKSFNADARHIPLVWWQRRPTRELGKALRTKAARLRGKRAHLRCHSRQQKVKKSA